MENTRILIVDDEMPVAKAIESSLIRLGYEIPYIVSTGNEAIEKSEKMHPDLVLMDIKLPGTIDGIKAAETIRTSFDIPVIFLTGYADEELINRAKLTMPFGYILKPPEAGSLHSMIQIALYKHKTERELKKYREHLETQVEERINELSKEIVERKKAEEALKESIGQLRKVTGGVIDIIVMAVETRDPYTAGHQKRVSNLARSIATEMGLPRDQVDGIRVAGVIHDLGKISVPAEILSKPSQLNENEFNLIKVHPRSGYDILKNVEFSWPLAKIVLQHHERLNGAGYPEGIRGDEILLEAKIIAVADVVEAMASHRPYRPSKGIDAAIEEIEKNKGILYDDRVVDACLRLFRSKGFTLD